MVVTVTAPLDTVKLSELNEAIPLLEVVAFSPVIVRVFAEIAVTIPSPFAIVNVSPSATASDDASLPVIVIPLFDSEELAILLRVFEEPLIVLLVSV
jgi:hypothetical protein